MFRQVITACAAVGALAGCQLNSSSNPLLFAQDITLGVSGGPSATSSQAVDFSLGFHQKNVAIIPTIIPQDVSMVPGDTTRRIVSRGKGNDGEQDTLSTFGSFSGGGNTTSADLGVFFATGIAAQNLSKGFACGTSFNRADGCPKDGTQQQGGQ